VSATPAVPTPSPTPPIPKPTRSVVYKRAGGQELRLFIFEPSGFRPSDRRPCFLMIHGGGWASGKPEAVFHYAEHFAKQGMVGVSLQYRLYNPKTGVSVADCVRDGRSAVRWLRSQAAELGIDPDKIVVAGGSAGGHLAAGTALFEGIDEAGEDLSVSSRPSALVLFCPVLDTSAQGYGFAKVGEQWRELSPIERMRSGMPPTLIFHAKDDHTAPYRGSVVFVEAMKKSGNICELATSGKGGHRFMGRIPGLLEESLVKVENFLRSQGIDAEAPKQ